jgi:hypothetical protein
MTHRASITLSSGLIGLGVCAWTFAGIPLAANSDLNAPLNPLGINGSPYGEVFAMAMQGPIDTVFHAGMGGEEHHHEDGEECESCKHDHDHDKAGDAPAKNDAPRSIESRLQSLLNSLGRVAEIRTNPRAAGSAHKLYLRRKTEDKLRFAYQLDPAHYANYNSLHFFLTEPEMGTRPQLTASAAKLAEDTIQYCLKQESDPRPALTAAAAASNILELMFNDRHNPTPKFTTAQMRQYLNLLDFCIARYNTLAKRWEDSKNWELLSPMRMKECADRFQFISKFREVSEGTLIRLEKESPTQPSSD